MHDPLERRSEAASTSEHASRACAKAIICGDLKTLRTARRRHFAPPFVLALVVAVAMLAVTGVRADLWDQPVWRLASQIAAWWIGLALFPMIGVGLWFPSRVARHALAVGGVAIALVASAGWERPFAVPPTHAHRCWLVLTASAFVFLGIGALSGAFAQRRCTTASLWLGGGAAFAALDLATWVCPDAAPLHVMPMHFIPALVVAVLVGVIARHLRKRSEPIA